MPTARTAPHCTPRLHSPAEVFGRPEGAPVYGGGRWFDSTNTNALTGLHAPGGWHLVPRLLRCWLLQLLCMADCAVCFLACRLVSICKLWKGWLCLRAVCGHLCLIYLAASAGVSGTRRGSKGLGKATFLATCTLWITAAAHAASAWWASKGGKPNLDRCGWI